MARRPAQPDNATRMLDAALRLAADRDWSAIGMADIASEAGLTLAEARAAIPDKPMLLAALLARTDQAMLAEGPGDPESPARDRLFDLIMRRFDALAPHKQAVGRMMRTIPRDPLGGLVAAPLLLRGMAWALEACGIATGGLRGLVRIKALAALYLRTMRTWLADESVDNATTMAALDKNLKRAARWVGI